MGLTNICILITINNSDRKILEILLILLEKLYKLMWQLIWYVNINNLLTTFLNYFLWLLIHLCKFHVIKFIISLTSFIQILVYYLLEMPLIIFIATSFRKLKIFSQRRKSLTTLTEPSLPLFQKFKVLKLWGTIGLLVSVTLCIKLLRRSL